MKRSALALGLTLFALCAPRTLFAQAEAEMDVYIPYTQFRLDNGLNVIVHEDRSIPVVSVNLWYHVGSKNEMPGRTGFAHLFEHIMFEGSAHVPEGDFDNHLEAAVAPGLRGRDEAGPTAGRGEERAPSELQEPTVRDGVRDDPGGCLSARPPLPLARDRLDGRSFGSDAGGRVGLLPDLLCTQQRLPLHIRRRFGVWGSASGGEVLRGDSPRP